MTKNIIDKHTHICLKFGKEEFMTKFLEDGEIYFNTLEAFREHENNQIGDDGEGFIRIPITDMSEVEIDGVKFDVESVAFQFDDYKNKNVFCLYILEDEIVGNSVNSNGYFQFPLNEHFNDDWTHFVMIRNTKEFYKRITDELIKTERTFTDAAITYADINDSSIAFNHFTKDLKYQGQNEWRFLIEDTDNKPIKLYLGDLKNIASLCPIYKDLVIYIGPFEKINNGKTK